MIRIVTDSASDLERHQLEKWNVELIPLPIRFGEQEYLDGAELSKERFYQLLLEGEHHPKTSQPAPEILMDKIASAKEQGDELIYIALSSALSGTYQSAVMIAEDSEYSEAYVMDSRNATGGQMLLVQCAVRLREEGKSAREIVAELEKLRERITLYACIDTLEYLYKGGRISKTVYQLGNMANIKPIIRVDEEGAVAVPSKVMGMRKGMATLCKRLEQTPMDDRYPFYAMYTNHREVAQTLAKQLADHGCTIPDDRYLQVGAAIGSHIGPDACGIVYVAKE